MSGDNGELNGTEVLDSPEDVTEARAIGWLPPEEYKAAGKRGEPISAKEFLDRGHAIMPFLKRDNDKLSAETRRLNTQLAERDATLRGVQEQMDALQEYHEEQRKNDRKRIETELRAELAQAMKDGDATAVADITADIALHAADKGEEGKGGKGAGGKGSGSAADPTLDPVFVGWRMRNSWVDTDVEKTRYATGVFLDVRQRNPNLFGSAFYDLVDVEMTKFRPAAAPRVQSKVDGGGAGSGGGSDGKSYTDLPADAKAACDRFGKKFVKAGGKYPTQASWRQKYCADFFSE